jgi:type III secretory pathway component EscV
MSLHQKVSIFLAITLSVIAACMVLLCPAIVATLFAFMSLSFSAFFLIVSFYPGSPYGK